MPVKKKKQAQEEVVENYNIGPRLTKKEVLLKTAQGIYHKKPSLWVPDATGYILDPWQEEAIDSLFLDPRHRTSVAASHGAGKTWLSGILTHLFLCLFSPARVALTGPTGHQTRETVWSGINVIWSRSVFRDDFEWQATKMYLKGAPEESFAVWRTCKDPKTIEGFHGPDEGKNLLWIVEEAKKPPEPVFESIIGALSHRDNYFYIASTCGGASGFFFKTFHTLRNSWHSIRVPWYKSSRISPEQVERWKETWGEDSPIFRARVMAEFPEEDEQVIVPLPWLERAVVPQEDNYREAA